MSYPDAAADDGLKKSHWHLSHARNLLSALHLFPSLSLTATQGGKHYCYLRL